MNDGFVFYKSFLDSIRMLPAEERLKAYDALAGFAIYGEEPQDDGLFRVVFEMAKPQIEANQKRRSGGSKGGRPKEEIKGFENEKPMVFEMAKPMVSENENLNININKKENINIKEKINKKESRFIPPTADEVREYCGERGLTVNAESFVDFYSSKNWYVGKNKMVDWHAACRNWSRNQIKEEQQATGARDRPKNKFCNFKQRDDDLDALAKQLATQGMGVEE